MNSVLISVQVIVALGLLNVWLLRNKKATAYRGGSARTLKDEFQAYGLPSWVYLLVGFLKVGSAIALLIGIFQPSIVPVAAGIVGFLMLGAVTMHIKVKDPLLKSVPALIMLGLNGTLLFFTLS